MTPEDIEEIAVELNRSLMTGDGSPIAKIIATICVIHDAARAEEREWIATEIGRQNDLCNELFTDKPGRHDAFVRDMQAVIRKRGNK